MKVTAAIIAATAAKASAFSSVPVGRSATSLNEFANGLVGGESVEPMPFRPGNDKSAKNFDPLGLSERAPEWVNWFREAELKHGRQAMLAVVGLVVPEFVRIPGEAYSFEAIPKVIDAHDALLDTSMKQILLWISLWEAMSFGALSNMNEFDREPGNFGFDPLGLMPKDEAGKKAMQLKELKNGRLAMVAIGGMIHGAIVTGKGFPYF
ncbi:hypothetical protein HJC23_000226 [Cyclotella cryptica]|uniref:Uncharacterized protein n=1 Tax=Cyclotella cryptica TaxID=29204 RepID=A0ABD3PME9_9STRA|eukprot:CCRYP_013391-RA/>CCRYP_013391-RA protein AED:0.04 eAED:0.04 QI:180/1/1/1/1/1/2/268/207